MTQGLVYPPARRGKQVDVYFGTEIADPYRWMEDVDSAEVKSWVEAENALTQGFLADVAARGRIHARLMELNNFERFSAPAVEAGRYFYRRNSGLQNQAVLLWQASSSGEATVLLDPNTLAADGTVALNTFAVSADGRLMAYSISEAGSDVQKVRVKDVDGGEDLSDVVEWVKFSGMSWAHDASGFFYSSFGPPASDEERSGALKRSAVFHKLYFHKLGTPQSEDRIVFERADDGEMLVSGGVSEDGHWLFIGQSKGNNNALCVLDLNVPNAPVRHSAPIPIALVDDARYEPIASIGTELWMLTTKGAQKGSIVRVDLERPERAHWVTIVPEGEHSIDNVGLVDDTLMVSYLVDAKTEIRLYALDGSGERRLELPGIGLAMMSGGKRTDTETFVTFTNYTTPATV